MEKVAVYTRVSTGSESQLTSLDNQQNYYRDYCIKNNFELVQLYADEGLSATSPNREKFLNMLYDAGLNFSIEGKSIRFTLSNRKPLFKYIITKDVSRFARNVNAIDIARMLVEKGVYINFENMTLNTEKENWQFEFSLYLTFAQQESLDRSKKVGFAYKQRAAEGKFHMTNTLYGYYYDEEENKYTINDEEADVVRLIYDMYINQDLGARAIARRLNDKGLLTRKGVLWRDANIRRMIRNEKYKGTIVLRRLTKTDITGSGRVIQRDEDDWTVLDNHIDAIVDEETWNKAQEIMESRTVSDQKGNRKGYNTQIDNIFHKKMSCSKCGEDFIRVSGTKIRKGKKVKEFTYYCRNRRMHNKCDQRGISHNVLMRELERLQNGHLSVHQRVNLAEDERIADLLISRLESKKEVTVSKFGEIKGKIEKIDEKSNTLLEALSENVTLKDMLVGQLEKLAIEKQQYENELKGFQTSEIERLKAKINERLARSEKFSRKIKFTFEEVLELLDDIVIHPDKEIEFVFNFPSLNIFQYTDDISSVIDNETYEKFTHRVKY
ncbi:MAG: recombinase family protein [Bacillaceae bacterium]|nr:recombinase family protein [Bacillaceae bacterium]